MRGHLVGDERRVCLVRVGGGYHAIEDTCNHAGCLLSGGTLRGTEVVCPCHDMTFDVRTGALTCRPRLCDDQRVYRVEVLEGEVWVDVE